MRCARNSISEMPMFRIFQWWKIKHQRPFVKKSVVDIFTKFDNRIKIIYAGTIVSFGMASWRIYRTNSQELLPQKDSRKTLYNIQRNCFSSLLIVLGSKLLFINNFNAFRFFEHSLMSNRKEFYEDIKFYLVCHLSKNEKLGLIEDSL